MVSTDTMTLKNQAGTTTATIRYPIGSSGYPQYNKTFTKYQLADGSFSYDLPSTAVKRRWDITIDSEDASDALLTNLKTLFDLTATLHLDVDVDAYGITESNIDVVFEEFQPIPVVGSVFQYRVVLQET